MQLNDVMVCKLMKGADPLSFKDMWYFTSVRSAKRRKRNIYTLPVSYTGTVRSIQTVLDTCKECVKDFIPTNEELLLELFPRADTTKQRVQVEVIAGLPDGIESEAVFDEENVPIILLDVVNITDKMGCTELKSLIQRLLTKEFSRLLLFDRYPELLQADSGYKEILDKNTFEHGFVDFISDEMMMFQNEINELYRNRILVRSKEKMNQALKETNPLKQEELLRHLFGETDDQQFTSICGKEYFSNLYKEGGINAVMKKLNDGWHDFANMTLQEKGETEE